VLGPTFTLLKQLLLQAREGRSFLDPGVSSVPGGHVMDVGGKRGEGEEWRESIGSYKVLPRLNQGIW
jgi:hypothetical protein